MCLIAPHRQYGFESHVVGFVMSAFLAHLEAVVASDGVVGGLGIIEIDRRGEGGCRSALGCVALIWWIFLIRKLLGNEK